MEKLHISDLFKTLFVLAPQHCKISDILLSYRKEREQLGR